MWRNIKLAEIFVKQIYGFTHNFTIKIPNSNLALLKKISRPVISTMVVRAELATIAGSNLVLAAD
jgi:hypothetical protein